MAGPIAKGASCLLTTIGVLFSLIALLAGMLAVQAFLDRAQHGRGIMFADAEFLTIVTVACAVVAAVALLVGAKLRGH